MGFNLGKFQVLAQAFFFFLKWSHSQHGQNHAV